MPRSQRYDTAYNCIFAKIYSLVYVCRVFAAISPSYKVYRLKNSKFALLAKWYILIL